MERIDADVIVVEGGEEDEEKVRVSRYAGKPAGDLSSVANYISISIVVCAWGGQTAAGKEQPLEFSDRWCYRLCCS